MQKILEGSYIYRFFAAVFSWFGVQWRKSRIISRFLSKDYKEAVSENSFFFRVWLLIHRLLCTVFEKLRLNKLLRGSIFTMPFIWGFATVALAPILPTMAVLGLSLINIAALAFAFGCDRERKLAFSPANKYILLFALIYLVATLSSITITGSLFGGALTTLFILYAIVIQNSVATRRQLNVLVYALVISGMAVALYGLYQYFFGAFVASGWVDSTMFSEIGVRVYSTLDNPNTLSMYLLLVIPFACACILNVKKILPRLFFIGCLCVMLICMLLTFARGGWLGLIIAAAVFLIMLDRRFILVGIVGIVLLYFMLPDFVLDRFLSIGNVSDSSTSYRVSIWLGTLAMLRDYWFTGIGPGTEAFNMVYPLYSYNTAFSLHSHNLYLQLICDAGVCGILGFFAILFAYFRNLCASVAQANGYINRLSSGKNLSAASPQESRTTETVRHSKILQIAAIASVIGFLVQSATDYSFYNYRVTLVFWAVIGLGLLAARFERLAP